MSRRSLIGWALVFVVLALAGGGGSELLDNAEPGGDSARKRGGEERVTPLGRDAQLRGRVVDVVDGDTVRVRLERPLRTETVRYIGVDTPESVRPGTPVQCYAKAAAAFNRRLVLGRRVRLRPGVERRDRYGRLLAYVYVIRAQPVLVNAALLRRGYARTLEIPPNTARADFFAALEGRARAAGRGLWSACGG